jgi:uncharacterized protein with PQ loop repeat
MFIFGLVAAIASLTLVALGLPAQIVKNYRRKSCEGLSPILFSLAFCTYLLWSLYGWTKPDWFLASAQTPGLVLATILLGQMICYRRKS